jgi:hypothetical protein
MVRKQVYIEAGQEDDIKVLARQLGVTEAYIIRRGIELVKRELMAPHKLDVQAGKRLIDTMRMRALAASRSEGGRKWTREDAYEERLTGLSDRH